MMNTLFGAADRISTKYFSWVKTEKTFSVFDSDLSDFSLGRVFEDAADVGFVLVSAKTHEECRYTLHRPVYKEGEITHWEFIPYDRVGNGTKVIIFND